MSLQRRVRRLLGNLMLVLAGLVAALLLLELFLCQPLLPHLPKAAYHHMIRELRVLGQSSYTGRLPEPGFVALAGDSNAQGKGDWFIDQGYDRTKAYHSAHVLQQLLHKDVLSFGRSGAGSADGLLLEPLQIQAMLARYDMPLPGASTLLAMFYEGNDIENNLDFLRRWVRPKLKQAAKPTLKQVEQVLAAIAAEHADGTPRQLNDMPVCSNFLLRSLRNTLRNNFTRKYIDVEPPVAAGEVNVASIAGKDVALPDRLQSPPLQLDADELERGVLLLKASLALLAEHLKPTPVVVVYVPAPLSCYELISSEVSTYYGGAALYPANQVDERSDELYAKVARAADELGLNIIDTRPALRAAAAQQEVHGPRDWDHLNKVGYEALAAAVAEGLE